MDLAVIGIFAAMTCVVTMTIHIPIPGTKGYLNPGDVLVMTSALLLGKKKGALIGGIGSAMADLFLGYAHYAPITLIVKGLEGYVCGKVTESLEERSAIPGTIAGGVVMAIGYFFPEWVLYGLIPASGSFLPNLGQGMFGAAGALILYSLLKPVVKERFA